MTDNVETKLLTIDLKNLPVDDESRDRIISGVKKIVADEIGNMKMSSKVKINNLIIGKDWPGGGNIIGIRVDDF